MHVDYVEIIARMSVAEDDAEPQDVRVARVYVPNDTLDPDAVTRDLRAWLLGGRHPRFLLDERRRYVDVGAAGSSVEFVLTLLAGGAAGVALQETVDFIKARVGASSTEADAGRFAAQTTDELATEALASAERALGLGRGGLEALEVDRSKERVEIHARRTAPPLEYTIVYRPDQAMSITRKLPPQAGV